MMQQPIPSFYTACHCYTYLFQGGQKIITTCSDTSFTLDWHTAPFAAKQGIPTRKSSQLIDGLYHFRKSIPSITLLHKPSSTYSCNNTVTRRSPPSAINVNFNIRTSLHNNLVPFTTVIVITAPYDGCASIDWTTRGCTKLCIAPLSNIQLNDTPFLMATNYSKLGQLRWS